MSFGALERALEPAAFSVHTSPIAINRSPLAQRKRAHVDSPTSYPMHFSASGSSIYSRSPSSSIPFGSPNSYSSSPASSVPSMSPSSSTNFMLAKLEPMEPSLPFGPYAEETSASPFEMLLATPKADARPDMKRRKTAPAELAFISPGRSPGKRNLGKDGQDVWPEDVEQAFLEALRFVPKLGRKKILVNNKPYGRNELIADYLFRKTGKVRTRKQVSSHIQVLKNLRKDDPEFAKLIAEPIEGVDDFFSPEAIEAFGGTIEFGNEESPEVVGSPTFTSPLGESLLPLPTVAPNMMYRSDSWGPTSPALSDCSSLNSSISIIGSPYLATTPMPAMPALASAFKDTAFSFPSPAPMANNAVVMPHHLVILGEAPGTDQTHIFAQMDNGKADHAIADTIHLEDLDLNQFPGVAQMHDHLPCQFLHLKLDLALPHADQGVQINNLMTEIFLTAQQEMKLSVGTTIYQEGHQAGYEVEALPPAQRLASAGDIPLNDPVTLSPFSLNEPSNKHNYSYRANFITKFWSSYLGTSSDSADLTLPHVYAKTPAERVLLAADVQTVTMVQEYFVQREDGGFSNSEACSAGSSMGNVVLVVLYEFAVVDSLVAWPAPSPSAKMSIVQRKPVFVSPSQPSRQSPSSNVPRRPSMLSHSSLGLEFGGTVVPQIKLEREEVEAAKPVAGVVPRRAYVNKPNLSLRIPTPSAQITTPLHTPLPQEMSVAPGPPPMPQASSPSSRRRLARAWKSQSKDYNIDSPSLQTTFRHDDIEPLPALNGDGSGALSWMTHNAMSLPTPSWGTTANTGFATPFALPPAPVAKNEESYFGEFFHL